MICFGLCGMPGCGKRIVSDILVKKGFKSIELSIFLKRELNHRVIKINSQNIISLADELRKTFGNDVLAQNAFNYIKENQIKLAVIDGIRTLDELNYLRFKFTDNFLLIFVHSPTQKRHKSILLRKKILKNKKDIEDFDKVNLELGLINVILNADIIFDNGNYSMIPIKDQVNLILDKIGNHS